MEKYSYLGEKFINNIYKKLCISEDVLKCSLSSDDKNERLRKYFEKIGKETKDAIDKSVDSFKNSLYQKYIIKEENIPKYYYELQKKIALDRGYGHLELNKDTIHILANLVIIEQQKSLDKWIDYLMIEDNKYPEWFKFYVFQGLLTTVLYNGKDVSNHKMNEYSINIYDELNKDAVEFIYDKLVKVLYGNIFFNRELQSLLENGDFLKLYSYVLNKIETIHKEDKVYDGMWIKYNRGDDPSELLDIIQGKGTGWYIVDYKIASRELGSGDFYLYCTKDYDNEYKKPRIIIKMEDNSIREICGIASEQKVELEMKKILDEKLQEFSDRDNYYKKIEDMDRLSKIYDEYKYRELNDRELIFLYQLNNNISSFGYKSDPRIDEILQMRDKQKDLLRIFKCSSDLINGQVNNVHDLQKLVEERKEESSTHVKVYNK